MYILSWAIFIFALLLKWKDYVEKWKDKVLDNQFNLFVDIVIFIGHEQ